MTLVLFPSRKSQNMIIASTASFIISAKKKNRLLFQIMGLQVKWGSNIRHGMCFLWQPFGFYRRLEPLVITRQAIGSSIVF